MIIKAKNINYKVKQFIYIMINMEFKINIFHQTFNKIADESMFDNIVQKQQQIFDIHVYKIDFS